MRVITATFQPKRVDTLRDRARAFVGTRCQWEAAWEIEGSDSRVYAGQTAWLPTGFDDRVIGWAPTEDLADIVDDG